MTPETASEVVKGLSETQRRIVLNGYRPGDRFASIETLVRLKVMARRVCFPDGNGFPLTDLGHAVRDLLLQEKG